MDPQFPPDDSLQFLDRDSLNKEFIQYFSEFQKSGLQILSSLIVIKLLGNKEYSLSC